MAHVHLPNVRFVPKADIAFLFDYLVGLRKQRRWHGYTQCLSCLKIDHQLVLGRRLHRKVTRLLALEDAIDIASSLPVWIDRIWSIRDQAAIGDESAERIDCRQSMPGCERNDQITVIIRLARAINPEFDPRANSVIVRSMSLPSCPPSGLTSTLDNRAAD